MAGFLSEMLAWMLPEWLVSKVSDRFEDPNAEPAGEALFNTVNKRDSDE